MKPFFLDFHHHKEGVYNCSELVKTVVLIPTKLCEISDNVLLNKSKAVFNFLQDAASGVFRRFFDTAVASNDNSNQVQV